MSISQRKDDHISINLNADVRADLSAGFENWRLTHNALPEADFSSFSISSEIFGKAIDAPLIISSMTGGTENGERVNRALLEAAHELNIPFAMGSQRIHLEGKARANAIAPRKIAPRIPIFANIGAVQLNRGFGVDECRRATEQIEADALILHFNPLQELLQPDGDRDFSGILGKIADLRAHFEPPIIAKEVGWGFSVENARQLLDAGISVIDIAGAGGTSWAKVEAMRAATPEALALAEPFFSWGIPTAISLHEIHQAFPNAKLIASGGIVNGVEMAKAIWLGASLCGSAGILLAPAVNEGTEGVLTVLSRMIRQYRIARFLSDGIEINDYNHQKRSN